MIYKICMQTAAGEKHSIKIDDRGVADHAAHSAFRLGAAHHFRWIDDHVDWSTPGKAVVKIPFAGDQDWILRAHPDSRSCELCAS
jgi:hypothetical protein